MLAQFETADALHWLGRQLFNRNDPAAFFDPLLERIDPLLARQAIRARVLSVTRETADTRTFLLEPASRWPGFSAGQHIALTLEVRGVRHTRTFSLSSTPAQWQENGTVSVTVKRIRGGLATGWMHECLGSGDIVSISEAFGDFNLPARNEPALYIVGGSGITPVLSHLYTMAADGSQAPVTLLYFVRLRSDIIAAERLAALAEQWPALTLTILTTGEPGQDRRLSDRHLDRVAGFDACRIYLCGPGGLMDQADGLLHRRGIPEERIHRAHFGAPTAGLNDNPGGRVKFTSNVQQVDAPGDASLLEIAEASGLLPRHGCRMGICHQCSCRKISGTVINRLTGQTSGQGEETIRICVSVPAGAVSIDL